MANGSNCKNIENESLLIWNAEVYKSELEFSIDNELKKEYSTYDNYIKTNKNLIENLKNQRKMELYSLYNHMEPVENPISGAKNVELLVMSRVPIGMIFMFLLFVSFYGFPLFRERKLQLVNLVKTKNYNSKVIFVSKFLYYSSLLILLTLSFLFFFLIACTIYHVSLDSVFLTIKDGGVISFSFISYLIENVVRLFAIFHVLLLLFLAVSCIQKRVIVPYVFVLLLILFFYHPNASANPYYLTLSYNIVTNILNVQYLGDTFFIYLLVILIICVILYFINILIWKKKW